LTGNDRLKRQKSRLYSFSTNSGSGNPLLLSVWR